MAGWSGNVGSFRILENNFNEIVFARSWWQGIPLLLVPLVTAYLLFFSYSFYYGMPAKGGGVEKDMALAIIFLIICILLLPLNMVVLRLLLTNEKYEISRSKWALLKNGKRIASIDDIERICISWSSRFMRQMGFRTLRFKLENGTHIDTFSVDHHGGLVCLGEKIATFVGMYLCHDD